MTRPWLTTAVMAIVCVALWFVALGVAMMQ
jgi:hypothetical protein